MLAKGRCWVPSIFADSGRKMKDLLKKLNIKRIIIADDMSDNLDAAKQFADNLPYVNFEFYERGDLIIAQIPDRYKEIDLILTDRQMESNDAGLDVAEAAWEYLIPTFVCTGGYQHQNLPVVKVEPSRLSLPDGMDKDDPALWEKTLEGILNLATSDEYSVAGSGYRARNAGVSVPCKFLGEQTRSIIQGYLDIERK